jgi:predicted amidohydrolase YtcJ
MTDWPAVDRHWGERAARTYAFRSLLDAGAILAFGSDAPVEPPDPRLDLYAATTRRDRAGAPAAGWQPDERIALAQAFHASTTGPAAAAGQQGLLGDLVPGAFADMVAWTGDPLDAEGEELLALECAATFVDGRIVHAMPGSTAEVVLAD